MSRFCTGFIQQLKVITNSSNNFNLTTLESTLRINGCNTIQIRQQTKVPGNLRPLRIKYPVWYLRQERAKYNDHLTGQNKGFVKEVLHDTYGPPVIIGGVQTYENSSPLKIPCSEERKQWTSKSIRSGVIAKRLGSYPLFMKDGKMHLTTLFQVVDNHVIKYIPPEEFDPKFKKYKNLRNKRPTAAGLLVGAESMDPQLLTKEYCGLFTSQGMMPKKVLRRFTITADAYIAPGTPLTACHFKPGRRVDIVGKTIGRGFQGVMRRWGFHGMPASHGVTKSHRRPGCIGSGNEKSRVWPGQKMPGHMGNRKRVHKGAEILRINTKYNILYVKGVAAPGETGSYVTIFDTRLPLRRNNHHDQPYFPTFYPEDANDLPEDLYQEDVFDFTSPSIVFQSD